MTPFAMFAYGMWSDVVERLHSVAPLAVPHLDGIRVGNVRIVAILTRTWIVDLSAGIVVRIGRRGLSVNPHQGRIRIRGPGRVGRPVVADFATVRPWRGIRRGIPGPYGSPKIVFCDQSRIMTGNTLPASSRIAGVMASRLVAIMASQAVVYPVFLLRMTRDTTQIQGMMPSGKLCAVAAPAVD